MSSEIIHFFPRLLTVIEKYFNSYAEFARLTGMSRQNLSNWKAQYKGNLQDGVEDPDPDIKLNTLLPMLDVIYEHTDASILWVLTGRGQMEATQDEKKLTGQSVDHRNAVKALHDAEMNEDQILQYLLKYRKEIQSFLATLDNEAVKKG